MAFQFVSPSFCFGPIRTNSVLSGFSLSLMLDIHVFTSWRQLLSFSKAKDAVNQRAVKYNQLCNVNALGCKENIFLHPICKLSKLSLYSRYGYSNFYVAVWKGYKACNCSYVFVDMHLGSCIKVCKIASIHLMVIFYRVVRV